MSDTKKAKAIYQDLTDIAHQMNWPLVSLEDDFATGDQTQLTGIALTVHPKCETFFLCFDEDGNLCHPINMMLISEGHLKPEDASVFVKTQFAEPETHLWIIGLLKYIQLHYIPHLQVTDEAGYWETGDVEILEENMGAIDVKTEMMARVLASLNVGDIYDCTPEKMASWFEGSSPSIAPKTSKDIHPSHLNSKKLLLGLSSGDIANQYFLLPTAITRIEPLFSNTQNHYFAVLEN